MTTIEWVKNKDGLQGKSWNPITGCTKVSPGCKNCYAERMAKRQVAMGLARHKRGSNSDNTWIAYSNAIDPATGRWSGEITCRYEKLNEPLHWKKPRTIFVCSMSDLFHKDVPTHFVARMWDVMRRCPQHRFQILTKRSCPMMSILLDWGIVLSNVWLGVSVETPDYLWRVDDLRQIPGAVRFLSMEPLLLGFGSIDLTGIDWVIVGGESGPGARPMDPDWVRSIRDQCIAANVPFFFKQWGAYAPLSAFPIEYLPPRGIEYTFPDHHEVYRVGKKFAGRFLDGRTWDEMPSHPHNEPPSRALAES